MTGGTVNRKKILFVLCVWLLQSVFRVQAEVPITNDDVTIEIQRLVGLIKGQQKGNGSWMYRQQTAGFTALNVVALRAAGVPANDPDIIRALTYLKAHFPATSTYAVGLYAMAFQAVDAERYWAQIKRAADWLISHQYSGTWNYRGNGPGDHSVTQFALLGIQAALDARVPVPERILQAAENHFRQTQKGGGGWPYRPPGPSSASMTAAGLASLHICGVKFEESLELTKGPAFIGRYRQDAVIARGIKRLTQLLDFRNPYTAYAIERVGILFDRRLLGGIDWYREGCKIILSNTQSKLMRHCPDQFNLLFLAKGNTPLLLSKLQWGTTDKWNLRHNDGRNMVHLLSRHFREPMDWQVLKLKPNDPALARAPLLYISGMGAFSLSDNETKAMKQFIANRGVVLIAPNQNNREFILSSVRFWKSLYPGSRFVPLPEDHRLRGMYHDLYGKKVPLRVLRNGCSSLPVFICTSDFSLDFERSNPPQSARMLAANLARYALHKNPMVTRLAQVKLRPPPEKGKDYAAVPGVREGGLMLMQIRYDGEYKPAPRALANFQGYLREALRMPTAANSQDVSLTDPNLKRYPILYLSGHRELPFSATEKAALRDYLLHGGFLVADACCPRGKFDQAFRQLMTQLFKADTLEPIPLSSPIYHEPFAMTHPRHTKVMDPAFRRSPEFLWGIRHEQRYVVVYSPFNIGCSLAGHLDQEISGFTVPDSFRLFTNIISYALTY